MTIKELKALLNGCDENAIVLFQDNNGKLIDVIHGQVSKDGNTECAYLNTRHEFPKEWFDKNGIEKRVVKGVSIALSFEELDDELYVDCGEFGEKEVKLKLHDGWASGDGVVMNYPKLEELTDAEIEEIDDYLGGRITDSGFIGFDDVALMLGKLTTYVPQIKELDHDSSLICESIQEITLYAWPVIYGDNNIHDLDSREVLEMFRSWGEEFEAWWESHTEDWICGHDYLEEVQNFAKKKVAEYIEAIK